MPTLARDFEVIAVDQRGIGLSDQPQNGYDTATLAGDMVALMEALGHWLAEEAPEEMLAALREFLAPYRDGEAAAHETHERSAHT
jgi:pimeloyl-ACP methyl ester carboxylesterase